jgi:hypothetical protein
MKPIFEVEKVLLEVFEVLRRHNIPIESASLNISLLDSAFDEHFPQLKNYKAGIFNRPFIIENIPVLFQAQRRYPFDEIVRVLENEIRPPIETLAVTLQREYSDLKIAFVHMDSTQSPNFPPLHSYELGITCRFSDDIHAKDNELHLSIFLQQLNATEYPRLSTYIGWSVDEESGGDWGIDIVYDALDGVQDYSPQHMDLLRQEMPDYIIHFREEISRKLSGEPGNSNLDH